jgi:hypothetical protein
LNELGQGLTLSGIGILITFSALGILIGLILLLKVIFPEKQLDSSKSGRFTVSPPPDLHEQEELRRRAAVAGVALLIEGKGRSGQESLGKLLEEPVSGWWQSGVDRVQGKD